MKKRTLKSMIEQIASDEEKSDADGALKTCDEIIKTYPKNIYGYDKKINLLTSNFEKYLDDDALKQIKNLYEEFKKLLTKKYDEESTKIQEYLDDCKEVNNLKQVKKRIISKAFMKMYYENKIISLNNNINLLKTHNESGHKINNVYDLINGLFYVIMLLFNIMHANFFLVLTIPFGIFGLISVYKFIDDNFIKNPRYHGKDYEKLENISKDLTKNYDDKMKEIEKTITFLYEQKKDNLSKIPNTFFDDIQKLIDDDEEVGAKDLFKTYLTDKETFLNLKKDYQDLKDETFEEDELSKYIAENKITVLTKKKKVVYVKKLSKKDYILLSIFVIISVISSIILFNNFYELNLNSFLWALGIGLLTAIMYNTSTGKNKSLQELFNDNMLSVVFNSFLTYDLIYTSITKDINASYGFIEIPIIFTLILIGYVMIVSLIKFKIFTNKLRK